MKILCALLAAILTIPAVAAPAEEVPRTIDAFGRSYDVRHQFSMVLQARLGTEAKANFALDLLEAVPEFWSRSLPASEPDVICTDEFRAKDPNAGAADYDAALQTEAGIDSYVACLLKVMSEGPQAERYRDAYLASLAANQTLPFFDGLGEVDPAKLTPEGREGIRQKLDMVLALNYCIVREAATKVSLEALIRDPQVLRPIIDQVFEAGACESLMPPEVKALRSNPAPGG